MSGRDRWRGPDEDDDRDVVPRSDRPAPGKVASTSLIGNPNPPRTSVSPGKRTLTMGLVRRSPPAEAAVQRAGERAGQRRPGDLPGASDVDAVAAAGLTGGASPLPHLDRIQPSFGRHDVTHVRAYSGGAAADAAESLGARAYATGDEVAFRDTADLHTAAHEAAHVVQQRAGVARKGLDGGASDPFERHADQVADAVVRGESAEPLLDRMAGAGASPSVQRDADPNAPAGPAALHTSMEEPIAVLGTADNPSIFVHAAWLRSVGVAARAAQVTGGSHPAVIRAILDKLRPLYPWAASRPSARFDDTSSLSLGLEAAGWERGELEARVDRSIFLRMGLPPARPVQVFPTVAGVELWIDTHYSFPAGASPDPASHELGRRRLAIEAVEGLEAAIKAPMNAAKRDQVVDLVAEHIRGGGAVEVFPLRTDQLANVFGAEPMRAYMDGRDAAPPGEGSVIEVPGAGFILPQDIKPDEIELLKKLLAEIYGAAERVDGSAAQTTTLLRSDIEALTELDHSEDRAPLIQLMREMARAGASQDKTEPSGAENEGAEAGPRAPSLAERIAIARAMLRRQRGAASLGQEAPRPTAEGDAPLVARPVEGTILNKSGEINTGMKAHFGFQVDYREVITAVASVVIRWHAAPKLGAGDKSSAPIEEETTSYIDSRGDGLLNDKFFEVKFARPGIYTIHADVHHSYYYPNYFTQDVEVLAEGDRLKRMEGGAADAWGKESSREEHVFEGIESFDPADLLPILLGPLGRIPLHPPGSPTSDHAKGSRAEGQLEDNEYGAGAERERERLDAVIEKLAAIEKTYAASDPESAAIRQYAAEQRERLEAARQRIETASEDADNLMVQVQGFYASRTHGVRSGPLNLVAWFRASGAAFHGELWDHTELYENEQYHFRASAASFEPMMESLFVDLSRSYPNGSVSLAFQDYEQGLIPTDRFIRFTRVTDTPLSDIRSIVFSDEAKVAVNIAALLLTLFPPTAPIGIGLSLLYNGADLMAQIQDDVRKDTLRASRIVDVGLLALDLLPVVGKASKLVTVGARTYRVIEAAQIAGDAYLLAEEGVHQLENLRGGLVTQLAELNADIERRRAVNPSDPELHELLTRAKELEKQIHGAAIEVFSDLVGQRLIQMGTMAAIRRIAEPHLTGPGRQGHPGDPEPDPDKPRGGTLGPDVYELRDKELFARDMRKEVARLTPKHAVFNPPTPDGKTPGILGVDVGGKRVTVQVEFQVGKIVGDPKGSHGVESGPGGLQLHRPETPGAPWRAIVTVDEGLHPTDVRHVAGHELDETIEIIRRAEADPALDIEAEKQAGLMRRGAAPGTRSTAHDVAAARELESLFVRARKALDSFEAAREAEKTKAITIPKLVADEYAKHGGRLERMLDAMGFGEDAGLKDRLDVLDKYLEPAMALEIKAHILEYRERRFAEGELGCYLGGEFKTLPGQHPLGKSESLFDPDFVQHAHFVGHINSDDWAHWGVSGGHTRKALADFEAIHPQVLFLETGKTGVGRTTYHEFNQFLWKGSGPPPAHGDPSRPKTASDAGKSSDWERSLVSKTVADDVIGMMADIEATVRVHVKPPFKTAGSGVRDLPVQGAGGLKMDIHFRFTPPDRLRVETGYVRW